MTDLKKLQLQIVFPLKTSPCFIVQDQQQTPAVKLKPSGWFEGFHPSVGVNRFTFARFYKNKEKNTKTNICNIRRKPPKVPDPGSDPPCSLVGTFRHRLDPRHRVLKQGTDPRRPRGAAAPPTGRLLRHRLCSCQSNVGGASSSWLPAPRSKALL